LEKDDESWPYTPQNRQATQLCG